MEPTLADIQEMEFVLKQGTEMPEIIGRFLPYALEVLKADLLARPYDKARIERWEAFKAKVTRDRCDKMIAMIP